MMTPIVIGLGAVLVVAGIGLLLAPNQLARLSKFLNRKVFDDTAVLGHRILAACICFIVGATLLWIYFGHHWMK